MSALPPKADIDRHSTDVRFVPIADIDMQRKATYLLGCSLSVDARQETDMPFVAFPA